MTTKLKAILKGHKGAVSKVLSKFEDLKSDIPNYDELQTIEETLRQKLQTISDIHEKLLDSIPDDCAEEVETTVLEQEEYVYNLQLNIQKVCNFRKVTFSNLNANSQVFPSTVPGRPAPEEQSSSQSSSGIEPEPEPTESFPTNAQCSNNNHSSIHHRLPKLDLPKFDGNILEWLSFWDSYEAAIHTNPSLNGVQKFNYLKSCLRGESSQTIAGFALTNANYEKAVSLLNERYGQKDKIIQTYMKALLDVPAPIQTVTSLRRFYDQTETYIRGLNSLGQSENNYGSLLTPVILQKLPSEIRQNMTRAHVRTSWDLSELMQSLLNEVRILEVGSPLDSVHELAATAAFLTKSETRKTENKFTPPPKPLKAITEKQCVFCKGKHSSTDCMQVKEPDQRLKIVKTNQLCYNCLGHHKVSVCKSKFKCRLCSRRHHTSLCTGSPTQKTSTEDNSEKHNAKETHTSVLHSAHGFPVGPVLLKTAIATVVSDSTSTTANILFDEGSQSSFVTEALASKLHLTLSGKRTICLSGFGDRQRQLRHLETATVYLQTSAGNIGINVLIVPEISVPLKTHQQEIGRLDYLKGLRLAHPITDDEDFNIEILVGADHYWDIIQDKVIRGNGPTATLSKIGYLLSGPLGANRPQNYTPMPISMMNIMTRHSETEIDLEKFWKVESMGVEPVSKASAYDEYMTNYQEKNITFDDGKYHAKLPWRDDHDSLPSNEMIAKRRTLTVLNRLKKEPELLQKYGEIICEQERRGFVEKVADDDIHTAAKVHYIPHHPVKKESSTTPVRIVYDCSCKSARDAPSLNDCLLNTPPHLNELTAILLKFRQYKYAASTDIEKAFLNIGLHADDRDVTRFFWLSDPTDPSSSLQIYRFKSVLFGATSSPFILNATILKHLQNYKCDITEKIKSGLYVDNILTSFQDETSLLHFYTSSRNIFQKAAFNLRSWSSNSEKLRNVTKAEHVDDREPITKVLGMRWDSLLDELSFPYRLTSPVNDSLLTKREMLRESSSIFDPLGLLSPITVKGKILLQSLWQRKLDWDEVLPQEIITEWVKIRQELIKTTETKINRSFFTSSVLKDVTLHVFTDASMKAYGACAYLVSGSESALVMAKNRVAPIKQLTIPKLELSAALLGARLCNHISSNIECKNIFLWSDSQITLNWIFSKKKQNPFISNRVKEIQELTNTYTWRFCPTDTNPAHMLSRGISFGKFQNNRLWLNGPDWLKDEAEFPRSPFVLTNEESSYTLSEEKKNVAVMSICDENNSTSGILHVLDIQRFSSYQKLLRVTAYLYRFINNCRNTEKKRGTLESQELDTAAKALIRHVQYKQFPQILQYFSNHGKCRFAKPCLVKQLNLYLDDNIIRCRGRIANAPLIETARFPYLLPSKDALTELIIKDAHVRLLHSGLESTITFLRQKFWIPSIRQRVRASVRSCITCRKVIGPPYRVPDPPPLPADRLKQAPPFTVTGVDFTGALNIRTSEGNIQKVYICLFTCANTRAVHLEVVASLTSNAFILALRRFFSRKSTPKVIMSDNALTFIATAKVIKEEILSPHCIEWKFIPQHAPWYGGWWERLIGVIKNSIKKALGKSLISLEILQTIVTEVECIINDRPLTHSSADPLDDEPLTPSHLLYGRRITSPVYPDDRKEFSTDDTSHNSANKLHRFKSATIERFWSRWRHEYLTSLREFHKNSGRDGDVVKVGDVVQIEEDNLPRNRWSLGIIHDVISGRDGRVRAAKVKSKKGLTTRPIAKLYPLELP